jgi:FkbM family methyltransferase
VTKKTGQRDAMSDLRANVDSIVAGLYDLRRDPRRDLVLERAIHLADVLAAKIRAIAARDHTRGDSFSTGHLKVFVDNRERDFVFRPDSVGDTGVIEQIFESKDYDLKRFTLGALFEHYVESIRESGRRPLIVDAGANIGASPIYFLSQYPDATIVAIEPERRNCALLRVNCTGLAVQIIEAALCSGPGRRFLSDPGRSDWGFQVTDSDQGLYEVAAVSVPQILRDYPSSAYAPAIVKIDIEGSEKDLFSGEIGWLKTVPLLIIELHDWMLPGEAAARNFLRAISTFDFDFVHVGENAFCFNNALLKKDP